MNRNKWNASANGKKEDGGGCNIWVDGANTLNQANGNLNLTMLYSQGYTITTWDGKVKTADYISSEVTSDTTFLYGSFECRAKYANQAGSWPAFWLYGGDGVPCPNGNACEIDISEYWNLTDKNLLGQCYSVQKLENNCHRYYPSSSCDVNNFNHWFCASMGTSMDDNFHIYKCVWTPDRIDFYMDNVLKNTILKTSDNPDYFPYLPLSLKLSQQVTTLPCRPIECPQTSSFDYVKVRQFFLAPEITLSNTLICSSGTASLDIDSKATDITWQLTPASLFTTANGSEKIANISIAPGVNGEGKITYSFKMPGGESYTAEKCFAVGAPVISSISGPTSTPNNQWATYTAQLQSTLSAATDYNWILNPLNGNSVYDYGSTCDIAFYNSGNYQLVVQAKNSCTGSGYGPYYVTGIYVYNAYRLSISPTPTTTEATIELVNTSTEKTTKETEWNLEVYDAMQTMKAKVQKIKTNKHNLNTSGWKEGVYIVRAIIGKDIISGKLVVKQ